VLLVVDQFEEMFTMAAPAERQRMDELLAHALASNQVRFYLLSTLRSDHLHLQAELPHLGALHNSIAFNYTLGAISEAGLREAIEQPARLAGLDVKDLTRDLLRDARDDMAGALPLVQHALSELYTTRDNQRLRLEHYEQAGGLAGMLQRGADALLAKLHKQGDKHARGAMELLLALTHYSPAQRHTRQPLALDAAYRQAGLGDAARGKQVVDLLAGGRVADEAHDAPALRLITTSGETNVALAGGTSRVDLIHETLLRQRPAVDGKPRQAVWPHLFNYIEQHNGIKSTLQALITAGKRSICQIQMKNWNPRKLFRKFT